jgi:PAS domain S-box-containing protein
MTELTGYTMAEINRLGWYQTVYSDPEVRERAIARMERMRAGDDLRQEEWTITRKDGAERVVAISTSRVGDGPGRAVVALMSDITARKRAEEALRQSQAQLAAAQRLAKLGSWWFDLRTNTVWWSDELFQLFGVDPETFEPGLESFLGLVHPEDVSIVRDALDRTLNAGAPYRYECRILRRDGSVWWKRSEGVLQRDADGNAMRLWGTTQDVTEQREAEHARRELEDQLREARRLESIGVLAGGIAHEFNNLLTTIIGHAELAESELSTSHPTRSHLAPIRGAAMRAADLCQKLLAYAGKGRLLVGEVDLNLIVRQTVEGMTAQVPVEFSSDTSPALTRGDAEQLRQLVSNIVVNAVEASRDEKVRVDIRRVYLDSATAARLRLTPGARPGKHVLVEVGDDGPGMDAEILQKAFEPFFSTKFPGRGLGLSVVLGVVRGHGGGLDVESAPGRGTTVRVYLPAAT